MKYIVKIPTDVGSVLLKGHHNVVAIAGPSPVEFIKGKDDIIKAKDFIFVIFSKLDKPTKVMKSDKGHYKPEGPTANDLAEKYKFELLEGNPYDIIPDYAPVRKPGKKPRPSPGGHLFAPPHSSPELKKILENQKIIMGLLNTIINQTRPQEHKAPPAATTTFREPKRPTTRIFMSDVLSGQHQRRR